MKLIGYWISSLRDTEYYPPQEFVYHTPMAFRTLVADYLDRGTEYEVYRGQSSCLFSCNYPKMWCRELSDGYFVWPEGLSHYVRDHDVLLPEDFIRHVQSGLPPIPKAQWTSKLDTSLWKEWCHANASEECRIRLESLRQAADRRYAAIVDEIVADMEASSGFSETCCLWEACKNRALKGVVFCARCILKGAEVPMAANQAYSGLRDALVPRFSKRTMSPNFICEIDTPYR